MKKIIYLFSTVMFFTIASCNDNVVETEKAPVTKKEVIVVPEPKKEEPKPTSITIDKKGVEVESKKVDVKIQPNN